MDVSHCIKRRRNNTLKSGIFKRATRMLKLSNSTTIKWQIFVDCYKLDQHNCLQLHRKLINDHLFSDNRLKMQKNLAKDALQKCYTSKRICFEWRDRTLRKYINTYFIFQNMRQIDNNNDKRLKDIECIADWFLN
ncbi:hypothetical protein MAR_034179 [Mya arenaria]|uniref:Uncharacterized protein n=1 Tax=Mya arenaria TaxID=6604 RepID=A0ABY7GCK2_MYAAR|nr:hypothetical protein MAR_034179 [Mya arenaria]